MAETKRSTDPIRVLSTEIVAQIFRYHDLGRDMAPRQVSKLWREKLSEGVVIEDVLNSFFTKNDPPLICESWLDPLKDTKAINLKKLEVLHRFRNGKPAKIVTLDLPKEFLHHNDPGAHLGGTNKVVILLPICPKDFQPSEQQYIVRVPGAMPMVLILVDLLTGSSSVIAKCDLRQSCMFQINPLVLQLPNSNLCEVMDPETGELLALSFGLTRDDWQVKHASLRYMMFVRPGELHRVLEILVWSFTVRRFCIYELDVSTLVDDFEDKSGGSLVLAHSIDALDSMNMCIRMAVPNVQYAGISFLRGREFTNSTCIVTIKVELGRSIKSWTETPGSYRRQFIPVYLAEMDGQSCNDNQDTFSIVRVEDLTSRALDLGKALGAYNLEGSRLFSHHSMPGGGDLLLDPISGAVRYIHQGSNSAVWGHSLAGTWKGIRYEAGHYLGTIKKTILRETEELELWIPNEERGCTDTAYRPTVLASRIISLPPGSVPDVIPAADRERRREKGRDESECYQWYPGDVKCNDRFLLVTANGHLVIASFDPDWNLDKDEFEPWDVHRHSVFHDLHAEDSSDEIDDVEIRWV